MVIPDLSTFSAQSLAEMKSILEGGHSRRTMAATKFNSVSTRSHAILQLTLQHNGITSKLSLIDLAGSERQQEKGQRMVEGANINKSLLALGHCITLLSDPKNRGKYIPYRNSKLTRLLKESLGGNTITAMLACINPTDSDETLNTLKYAKRAQNIKREVHKNAPARQDYRVIINSLK